ncbi:DUF1289 domain-containing protein [Sphingomonas sp. Leaf21]|jgi:predicted Fe-S protein YdhL (DUF1289 family)|uniref:DUF1289 domain-containing protein n=1 Tax=Sphingomonas sp. Leaf21 TaxID=2876550 RepID=UPI001E5990E2|nr:DUF1289 domain-containing protein [Sphingomonas sp. Leaf21]
MKSPCVDICRFDGRTGWCVACGRTQVECRGWRKAARPTLLGIQAELPRRLAKLAARGIVASELAPDPISEDPDTISEDMA